MLNCHIWLVPTLLDSVTLKFFLDLSECTWCFFIKQMGPVRHYYIFPLSLCTPIKALRTILKKEKVAYEVPARVSTPFRCQT